MINLKMAVEYADGTRVEVRTRPATEVAFERAFDLSLQEAFVPRRGVDGEPSSTHVRMSWLYFLAHHASRSSLGLDEWMETLKEPGVEMLESESPAPSLAAVSTEGSRLSPTT